MSKFRCGDVNIEIERIKRLSAPNAAYYRYSVELDGVILAHGYHLRLPLERDKEVNAAREILAFMWLAGEEERREWGWMFDADTLFDRTHHYDNGTEIQFIVKPVKSA